MIGDMNTRATYSRQGDTRGQVVKQTNKQTKTKKVSGKKLEYEKGTADWLSGRDLSKKKKKDSALAAKERDDLIDRDKPLL